MLWFWQLSHSGRRLLFDAIGSFLSKAFDIFVFGRNSCRLCRRNSTGSRGKVSVCVCACAFVYRTRLSSWGLFWLQLARHDCNGCASVCVYQIWCVRQKWKKLWGTFEYQVTILVSFFTQTNSFRESARSTRIRILLRTCRVWMKILPTSTTLCVKTFKKCSTEEKK